MHSLSILECRKDHGTAQCFHSDVCNFFFHQQMVRLTSAKAKGTARLHLRLWKATTSTMCHLFGLHNSSFPENKVLPLCIENDCFLFTTKMMSCTPVGTEEQGPILLTTMYDIHKMQSYQPSRCVLYPRIKTLFM